MGNRVRVGVIGAGAIGVARHLPAYKVAEENGKAELVAVCDPVEANLRSAVEHFEIANAFLDYRDLLALPDLDAVSICTPNVYHEPIALEALRQRRLHVMCEKPIAMSYAGARRMADAAREANRKTAVNFRYRWIPAAGFLRDLIRGGELGEIYHLYLNYFNGGLADPTTPIHWRESKAEAGTGALGDIASHLIDLSRFWIGELSEVTGRLRTFTVERPLLSGGTGQVDVDDAASFLARFAGGAEATFNASRTAIARGNHQRVEVYGTKGAAIYEIEKWDRGGDELQLCLGAAQARHAGFTTVKVPPEYLAGTPIRTMLEFVDGILADRDPIPNFDDGLRCQEVIEAVEISARERTTVALPLLTS